MDARSRLWIPLALSLLVFACASPPPPPPKPTVVTATFVAKENINPDARGRPSPVVVRLYELKAVAAFNGGDFFSIYDKETATLGGDLVAREEFTLRPGEQRTLTRTLQNDTRTLAVVAAFRDLERAQWRAVTAVPLNQTTPVTITFDDKRVIIAVRP